MMIAAGGTGAAERARVRASLTSSGARTGACATIAPVAQQISGRSGGSVGALNRVEQRVGPGGPYDVVRELAAACDTARHRTTSRRRKPCAPRLCRRPTGRERPSPCACLSLASRCVELLREQRPNSLTGQCARTISCGGDGRVDDVTLQMRLNVQTPCRLTLTSRVTTTGCRTYVCVVYSCNRPP